MTRINQILLWILGIFISAELDYQRIAFMCAFGTAVNILHFLGDIKVE